VTEKEHIAFKKKSERHFRSQRELPCGRDFRWNSERQPAADKKYADNFDGIFPNAPGVGM